MKLICPEKLIIPSGLNFPETNVELIGACKFTGIFLSYGLVIFKDGKQQPNTTST